MSSFAFLRTVVVVVVAVVAAVAVGVDYYVGLVDYVAVVDVEAVVDVTVVAVAGARPRPRSDVGGVVVAADDGLADVGAVAVADVHQLDRATDVPGAGPVTLQSGSGRSPRTWATCP